MGKRGPKPKLASLQRLEGNPSKRPIQDFGIAAAGEALVPDHLHEEAQACIEPIKQSMAPKTYATVDTFALSSFATARAGSVANRLFQSFSYCSLGSTMEG